MERFTRASAKGGGQVAGYSTTMTKETLILGLLKKKPMSGYDVKQLIEEELTNFAPISSGSLYHTLKALEKRGFVTNTVVKDGPHPEKRIYQITPKGAETFDKLISQNVTNFERPLLSLDVSLYFLDEANNTKFLDHMRKLLSKLKAYHKRAEKFRDTLSKKGAPYNIKSIPEHYLAHSRAEIAFLEEFIRNMESEVEAAS